MQTSIDANPAENHASPTGAWAEILLILALFVVIAGTPPPDVNEAHYLSKAKHYWDPSWCPTDHFLDSADAHLFFYWTFGWVTLFMPLAAAAWVGRVVTWGLLAWAWRRLSVAILPAPLFSVLTATLFLALLEWGHLAGEWMVGGVEAKGFAYIPVLLSLEALVRGRWRRAILWQGLAAAFHVLVGGWTLVATGFAWLLMKRGERPTLASLIPALVGAFLISLFGLWPGLTLSWGADSETMHYANRVYVYGRLSHHLAFHRMPLPFMIRHAALLVGWLLLVWWLPRPRVGPAQPVVVNRMVMGAVFLAGIGIAIDQILIPYPDLSASLLRYYWFRLSDVMLPLGFAFALARGLHTLRQVRPDHYAWALLLLLLVLSANLSFTVYRHLRDLRPGSEIQATSGLSLTPTARQQRYQEWLRVCQWIRSHTDPRARFLTPRHQQTFQWYAHRGEVVSAKDIPQNAAAIVEWRRRLLDIFPRTIRYADLAAHGEARLLDLAETYDFDYILIDRQISSGPLRLPRVYPEAGARESQFEVYLAEELAGVSPGN